LKIKPYRQCQTYRTTHANPKMPEHAHTGFGYCWIDSNGCCWAVAHEEALIIIASPDNAEKIV
jgi:hypothetical protein